MPNDKRALKIGLLIVAVSWFTFTFFHFISGLMNYSASMQWYIAMTEILGSVGLGFRTGASFIAVIAVASHFFFRSIGKLEALMALRLIVLMEALYYAVTFLPSAFWGVGPHPFVGSTTRLTQNMVSNFLPCIVEGTIVPIALFVLYRKLNNNKPRAGAIKWALIALTAYILAYWVTNTGNWILALLLKGVEYAYTPLLNLSSFLSTTVGLLLLAIFAAYVAKKSAGTPTWRELNLKSIGAIITLVGLYFAGVHLLWILAGDLGGWSAWNAWFLGHNVDLWAMILPAIGLPLMFYKPEKTEKQQPSL